MKKIMFIFLMPLILVGCATTMEYGQKLNDWIGHTADELYAKFGKPSSTKTQPDGGKTIQYERSEVVKAPPASTEGKTAQQPTTADSGATNTSNVQPADQSGTSAAATPPVNTRTVSCTTRYKADSTGVIRTWTIDGSGCKAYEEPYSKHP